MDPIGSVSTPDPEGPIRQHAPAQLRSPRAAAALCLALIPAGCGSFGLDPAPPETGDSAAAGVMIQGLSPGYGPLEGGTQVTITGWGFGETPLVTWGSTLADVEAASDTLLLVRSPASVIPGPTDVSVSSALGSYTLAGAFVYTEDGGDDTEGGGDDTGTGGTGGTGGAVDTGGDTGGSAPDPAVEGIGGLTQISYQYTLCPECFLPPLDSEQASAALAFFEPVSVDFLDHLPPIGTCASNVSAPDRGLAYGDAGSAVTLSSGSRLVTLYRSGSGAETSYSASTEEGTLSAGAIAHSAAYDLEVPGGLDYPAMTLDDALYTAQFFDDISPDISGQFRYRLSRVQSSTWSWAPAGGSGSQILITYAFYSSTSGAFTGSSVCYGNDVGSFTVPASAVIGGAGSYATITIARLESGERPMPDGRGALFYLSVAAVMGTGQVQ